MLIKLIILISLLLKFGIKVILGGCLLFSILFGLMIEKVADEGEFKRVSKGAGHRPKPSPGQVEIGREPHRIRVVHDSN